MRMQGLVLGCLFAIVGCRDGGGDSDSHDDQGSVGQAAIEDCEAFTETVCERLTSCSVSEKQIASSESSDFQDQCLDAFAQSLSCDDVVRTTDAYPRCIDDFMDVECKTLLADGSDFLPDSCHGVLLTQQ